MSVYEFIKTYGLDLAHRDIACLDSGFITEQDFIEANGFEFSDLRRVVESHDMILVWRMPKSWRRDYGEDVLGLEGAKMYLNMYGDEDLSSEERERFKQALHDVELCS